MLASLDAVALPEDAIEVAYIGEAWGIKGAFKVHPHSADPQAVFSSKRWFILRKKLGVVTSNVASKAAWLLPVSNAKEHGDAVVATSATVPDRNAAEALKGCSVWVPRTSFPSTESDEYYWVDLIGCAVLNREGVSLGVVEDLMSTGPQAVLVVARASEEPESKAEQALIPFVSAYVDNVDVAAKRIVVDWQLDY